MKMEAGIHNVGARPKVLREQHLTSGVEVLAPVSRQHSSNKTSNKRVTFSEVPIIFETREESCNNIPKKPQPSVSRMSRNVVCMTRPLARPGKPEPNLRKSHSEPPLLRKTVRPQLTSTDTEEVKSTVDVTKNVYVQPELHSSLNIAKMLQNLRMETFDSDRVLREKLEACPTVKKQMNEKSSRPVNVPPEEIIFRDVLPLEFDEQALLTAAAEDKEAQLLRLTVPVTRQRDPEPDIDEFFTDDMEPEFVAIPEPNFDFPHLTVPAKAPPTCAYHLYKHKRMWEGLP